MPNKTTAKISQQQMRTLLSPAKGKQFVCPVCNHEHLIFFGEDGVICRNDGSTEHTAAIYKWLSERPNGTALGTERPERNPRSK